MASLSLTNPSAVNLSPALLEALKPEEPVFSLAAKTSDTDAEPHFLGKLESASSGSSAS